MIILCPHCRQNLDLQADLAGRICKCPHCAGSLRVPAASRRTDGDPVANTIAHNDRPAEQSNDDTLVVPFDEGDSAPQMDASSQTVADMTGDHTPANDPRLESLLMQWEDQWRRGQTLSAADLCRECPELITQLAKKIDAVKELSAFLRESLSRNLQQTQGYAGGSGPADQNIPGYEIEAELGRGGMGVVYKAKQINLGRTVALKMILSGAHAGKKDVARFLAEAETVAQLQHPNIVQLYEFGDHQGLPYFTLEYIAGGSLQGRLKNGPLTAKEAAGISEQLARGMAYAHAAGIVHRDLKPANVLLGVRGEGLGVREKMADDGGLPKTTSSRKKRRNPDSLDPSPYSRNPKITDFGLVKRVDTAGMTASGEVMGTPSYMAPEQAAGSVHSVGPTTDIYALGAILYECLTGRPPHQAPSVMDTLLHVINEEPALPSRLQPNVPKDLETICLKCLQKEPGKRYASAAEFAEDLRRYQAGEPILARPVGAAERLIKWVKRRPVISSLLALVLLVMLFGAGGVTWAYGLALRERDIARGEKERADDKALEAKKSEETALAAKKLADQKAAETLAEKKRADGKAAEALAQKKRAENELQRAEWMGYVMNLRLAQREWQDNNARAARDLLHGCRWDFCGWEHDYLRTLLRKNQRTLFGHTSGIESVSFSPDGKTVATAGHDLTIKIWDADKGLERFAINGHSHPIDALAFSPDGNFLASGSRDGNIHIWNMKNGTRHAVWRGHRGGVNRVVYSPNGEKLFSVSPDETIRIWDIKTGKTQKTIVAHDMGVRDIAIDRVGKTLVTSSRDKTVKIWDAETGKLRHTCRGHTHEVWGVDISPDGKTVVSGAWDKNVKVWDAESGKLLRTLTSHKDNVHCVVFSPDGKRFFTGSWDRLIKVWDAATGNELYTLKGHMSRIRALDISPDGQWLVSAGIDRQIKIWSTRQRQETLTVGNHNGYVRAVAVSPDGKRLVSGYGVWKDSRYFSGGAKVSDVVEGRELFTFNRHSNTVISAAFSPDGKRVVSGGPGPWDEAKKAHTSGEVLIWDAATGQVLHDLRGHRQRVLCVAFSPEGDRVASGGFDRLIKIWDAHTGQLLRTLSGHTNSVMSVAFSPDGRHIVSGGYGKYDQFRKRSVTGEIKIWDTETGKTLRDLHGHMAAVFTTEFSPDGQRILTASGDQTIRLWDAATGRQLRTLRGHTGAVNQAAFSPDGKRIASAGVDMAVKIWDAETGREAFSMNGHNYVIYALAFGPNGKRIFSGSRDKTVRIWEATIEKEPRLLKGHSGPVYDVALTSDGHILATASADHLAKLWDFRKGREIMTLKGHDATVRCVAISPDDSLAATGAFGGEVRIWNLRDGKEVHTLREHKGNIMDLAFSPDGQQLATAGAEGEIGVWNVATGRVIRMQSGHPASVHEIAYSPDGRYLASCDGSGLLKIWDAATGKPLTDILAHTKAIYSLAFHPDGKILATGSDDKTIKLWDINKGTEIKTFRGHLHGVHSVRFSPDGKRLAGSTQGRTLKIWDLASGKEALTLSADAVPIWEIAFSPDGKHVVAGCENNTVKVWAADMGRRSIVRPMWVLRKKAESDFFTLEQLAPKKAALDQVTAIADELTNKHPQDHQRTGCCYSVHVLDLKRGCPYQLDLSAAFDTYLRLESMEGQTLAADDDGGAGLNSRLVFVPREATRIRMIATSYRAGSVGPYRLLVTPLQAAGKSVIVEDDITTKDVRFRNSLAKIYTIKGTSGAHYRITAKSARFAPLISVTNGIPQTNTVSSRQAATSYYQLIAAPRSEGTVRFVLHTRTEGKTGAFNFSVQPFVPSTTESAAGYKIYRTEIHFNYFNGQLTNADKKDSVLKNSYHKVHTYRFEKGQSYFIDLTSSQFDTMLRLEDSAGKQIAIDDDGGTGLNSRMQFTPPQTGDYRIIATSYTQRATGAYNIRIRRDVDFECAE